MIIAAPINGEWLWSLILKPKDYSWASGVNCGNSINNDLFQLTMDAHFITLWWWKHAHRGHLLRCTQKSNLCGILIAAGTICAVQLTLFRKIPTWMRRLPPRIPLFHVRIAFGGKVILSLPVPDHWIEEKKTSKVNLMILIIVDLCYTLDVVHSLNGYKCICWFSNQHCATIFNHLICCISDEIVRHHRKHICLFNYHSHKEGH